MNKTYMDKIRAVQAKVRAFVPLTDDEMETIRAYAKAKGDELIAEHKQPKSRSHARKKTAGQLDGEIVTALRLAWESARDLARSNPTPENREAAKAAWSALEAASPRQKVGGYASRAGKRQWAEMWAGRQRRGHY